MKRNKTNAALRGIVCLAAFAVWTLMVKYADVQPVGVNGTNVGLAALNLWVHRLTGAHFAIYTLTDWLGLVPVTVCMGFGALGLWQWLRRRSLKRVDPDLIVLGAYFVVVMACYLLFEELPMHYRPVLIEGRMEASYPSSTTLLTLCVMPVLTGQLRRRCGNRPWVRAVGILTAVFCAAMVVGRLLSGVHWLTDIVGGALLSAGLYWLYRAADLACAQRIKEK